MHSLTKTPVITATNSSHRAEQLIELGLSLDPEARSEAVARLIAATIHDGSDTALHRFAGTGELQHQKALEELTDVIVPFEQEGWVDALGRHILYAKAGGS
ncbi:hypothetical protein QE410_003264 [Microbacterium sp. SORGH_AS 1204]|uniref:hypothetical protein n=1 Tax=Microbacterium sp. SORGH_AS_1204 TaxID=3041785 RepID=UPI00278D6EA1|nr:hypothetical protein [Microbacterium sp. SORGH_AS_1204]MDQ1138465.1 hypothetical protein [Microbacterium sp. SORGH_AS_1204]